MKNQQLFMALGVFCFLGVIVVVAIVKYDTADEAMQVFAGLWGALGAGVGLVFAHFFTQGTMQKVMDSASATTDVAKGMTKQMDGQQEQIATMHEEMSAMRKDLVNAMGALEPDVARTIKGTS